MPEPDTTQLLMSAREGDRTAFDLLYVRLYDELWMIARRRLAQFRPGDTLDTGALVHETYLRLVDQTRTDVKDRAHFLTLAARAMRFIIVDYARGRTAAKRGGGAQPVQLDSVQIAAFERGQDILALDEALEELHQSSERLGRLVELRFFGGLKHEEIAELTGLSVPTVKRDWARARAWLHRMMHDQDD